MKLTYFLLSLLCIGIIMFWLSLLFFFYKSQVVSENPAQIKKVYVPDKHYEVLPYQDKG